MATKYLEVTKEQVNFHKQIKGTQVLVFPVSECHAYGPPSPTGSVVELHGRQVSGFESSSA